jgi:hypothetical protein
MKPDSEMTNKLFPLAYLLETFAKSPQLRKQFPQWPDISPVRWISEYLYLPAAADANRANGGATAIAADAADNIHIAYWSDFDGAVKYALKNGAVWEVPIILDPANVGPANVYVSLALSANGDPHVCFNLSNGNLRHAWKVNGAWNVETIVSGCDQYSYVEIVIDPSNVLHVLYTTGYFGNTLQYITKTGTAWSTSIQVDTGSTYPGRMALAMDSKGTLHALCITTAGMAYINKPKNAAWNAVKYIDNHHSMWPSLAIDQSDVVHVAYYNHDSNCIQYAMKSANNQWQIPKTIVQNISTYGMNSIAVTKSGNVALAYYDTTAEALFIIWKSGSTWGDIQTIDAVNDSGAYCHLIIDSHNTPHVSYLRTIGASEVSKGTTTILHAYLAKIRS